MSKSFEVNNNAAGDIVRVDSKAQLTRYTSDNLDSDLTANFQDIVLSDDVTEHQQQQQKQEGSDIVVNPGSKEDPFRSYRFIKQACLICVWICIGLAGEITGPTIPDLTERLCVNYEEISRALISKSVGLGIGSLVGGFANEIFYRHVDLLLGLSLILMGVACGVLPLINELGWVAGMLSINGFTEGIINTGGNTMVMDLWGVNAAPPMHSLHFGFGFGALLAPQIARPFLSPDADEDANETLCDGAIIDANGTVFVSQSRIEVPYGIIGGMICLFAVCVLGFYMVGTPKGFPVRQPNASLRTLISPATCAGGYTLFGVEILICLFIYFIQAVGGERAYGKFLFSFAIESDVNFSKDTASYLQSAFWASFTTGRLLGIPLSHIFSVKWMIIGDIIGALITSTVLSIWAPTVPAVLWVFTCFMGIFIAVVFPNGMSWSNIYMNMNSMSVMILLVGGSVGGFIYQSVAGTLFENEGPETLMYIMVVYAVALAIIFAIMQAIASLHLRKHPDHLALGIGETVEEITVGATGGLEKKLE